VRGNDTSGSIKMLGIHRVASQLVASRVVLGSTEVVSMNKIIRNSGQK
jgi:hypothetical protein